MTDAARTDPTGTDPTRTEPAHSHGLLALPARAGGAVLATAVRGISLRPAQKPMHPVGRVLRGRLERRGLEPGTGVPFLDRPGAEEVVVRESKGIGLPDGLPDVHGLAIRVPAEGQLDGSPDGRHGDLLLATNGWGAVTRFLVLPSAGMTTRPLTTLMPYRTPTGPQLIGARYVERDHVLLAVASPRSAWRVFADLHLEPVDPAAPDRDDPALEFDPLVNEVPGLTSYDWARRLRAPAYRTARRSRR
ncbi:hypothetical protein [Nocardioides sp. SYSU DS0663]|uniref:hypothetical protein n=1 Tax=Nocardioides sp. SYSU DS0663 TaxID=3416445 RepID=UPI003F4C79FF